MSIPKNKSLHKIFNCNLFPDTTAALYCTCQKEEGGLFGSNCSNGAFFCAIKDGYCYAYLENSVTYTGCWSKEEAITGCSGHATHCCNGNFCNREKRGKFAGISLQASFAVIVVAVADVNHVFTSSVSLYGILSEYKVCDVSRKKELWRESTMQH